MEPSLVVIGVNFKNAAEAVRERFCLTDQRRDDAVVSLLRSEGIEEAVALATAARTEFIVWASDVALAANSVLRFLTREFELRLCEWSSFYRLLDDEALLHVFRVGAHLDSGEDEGDITLQLRFAWESARLAGSTGRYLDEILTKALKVSEQALAQIESEGGDRRSRVHEVEQLVATEAQGFRKKLMAEQVVPTIAALRTRLDEICRQELAQLSDEFGPFTEDQRQALNKLAAHITQRIAGGLARELKGLPERDEQEMLASTVQRLFHLKVGSVMQRKN